MRLKTANYESVINPRHAKVGSRLVGAGRHKVMGGIKFLLLNIKPLLKGT